MTKHTFSSSRSSLKKKAALCAWKSEPRSSSCWRADNIGGSSGSSCVIGSTSWTDTGTRIAVVLFCEIGLKISAGRTPRANAAASDAGRLAARDEMIFLRNL